MKGGGHAEGRGKKIWQDTGGKKQLLDGLHNALVVLVQLLTD
jgi:hypothetical protein